MSQTLLELIKDIQKWEGLVDIHSLDRETLKLIKRELKLLRSIYRNNVLAKDAKTLKALKGSIRKWEKIVTGTGVDKGKDNCPLCQKFQDRNPALGADCIGCPVAIAAKMRYCRNTPYEEWDRRSEPECNLKRGYNFEGWPEKLDSAKKELNFLKSLLPKGYAVYGNDYG